MAGAFFVSSRMGCGRKIPVGGESYQHYKSIREKAIMNTHIFAAHAQLPVGTDLQERFKVLTLVVVVDIDSGKIIDCVVPMYCKLHNDFVANILRGKCLDNDKGSIIEEIDERIHTVSKRALITTIQGLHNNYIMVKKAQREKKLDKYA